MSEDVRTPGMEAKPGRPTFIKAKSHGNVLLSRSPDGDDTPSSDRRSFGYQLGTHRIRKMGKKGLLRLNPLLNLRKNTKQPIHEDNENDDSTASNLSVPEGKRGKRLSVGSANSNTLSGYSVLDQVRGKLNTSTTDMDLSSEPNGQRSRSMNGNVQMYDSDETIEDSDEEDQDDHDASFGYNDDAKSGRFWLNSSHRKKFKIRKKKKRSQQVNSSGGSFKGTSSKSIESDPPQNLLESDSGNLVIPAVIKSTFPTQNYGGSQNSSQAVASIGTTTKQPANTSTAESVSGKHSVGGHSYDNISAYESVQYNRKRMSDMDEMSLSDKVSEKARMQEHIRRLKKDWEREDQLSLRRETQKFLKTNGKIIASLQERYKNSSQRSDEMKTKIENMRMRTQDQINQLAYKVDAIGDSIDDFEQLILGHERNIEDESHREKSKWEETLQKKIKQQLEAKEEAYFDLIDQLQSRIKILKDSNRNSSSILDGFFHRTVGLAISGFGIIISLLVLILSFFSYPYRKLTRSK